MNWILSLLLGGLGSPSFDTRQAASGRLVDLWPLSSPAVLVGCGSKDAEVRYRCERALDGRGEGWQVLALAFREPAAAMWLARPNSPEKNDQLTTDQTVELCSLACRLGLIGENETVALSDTRTNDGVRWVVWARARAMSRGVPLAEILKTPPHQLVPQPLPGK